MLFFFRPPSPPSRFKCNSINHKYSDTIKRIIQKIYYIYRGHVYVVIQLFNIFSNVSKISDSNPLLNSLKNYFSSTSDSIKISLEENETSDTSDLRITMRISKTSRLFLSIPENNTFQNSSFSKNSERTMETNKKKKKPSSFNSFIERGERRIIFRPPGTRG